MKNCEKGIREIKLKIIANCTKLRRIFSKGGKKGRDPLVNIKLLGSFRIDVIVTIKLVMMGFAVTQYYFQ